VLEGVVDYVEEKELEIRIRFRAAFSESYQGDDDGYEWWDRIEASLRQRLQRAVIEALAAEKGFRITPVSRGHAESRVYEVLVERVEHAT
jgi:hypothetical protein